MPNPSTMTTSPAGLEAGQYREGFRDRAYKCSANKWTIGFGATFRYVDGDRIPIAAGDTITEREAAELFAEQWREHESGIARAISRDLTQPQFDVLADMAFQFGPAFLVSGAGKTTGLRDAINAGAWEKVDAQIARWHYANGRRDPGVYTRALARVCQWHALPWKWLYQASTPDTIKRDDAGRVIETPFMKLDANGAVLEMVTPESALARARAVDAQARAKAPAAARVPPTPAPSIPAEPPAAAKPVIVVKPPPGVEIRQEAPPAPETPSPAPKSPDPQPKAAKPRKPIIEIVEPYKPISSKTISLDDLAVRGIDPGKGAKPMTESERFWGMFWIASGNILFQAASRGLVLGIVPSWATFLIVDGLRDPIILGALTSLTVALGAAVVAAPRVIKAGIAKLRRGRATASQLLC